MTFQLWWMITTCSVVALYGLVFICGSLFFSFTDCNNLKAKVHGPQERHKSQEKYLENWASTPWWPRVSKNLGLSQGTCTGLTSSGTNCTGPRRGLDFSGHRQPYGETLALNSTIPRQSTPVLVIQGPQHMLGGLKAAHWGGGHAGIECRLVCTTIQVFKQPVLVLFCCCNKLP